MDKKLQIKDLLKDDPFDLLKDEKINKNKRTSQEQRLIDSFEEISNFFEINKKEPSQSNITEFKLYARLKSIRDNPSKVKALLPYDFYGLISSNNEQSFTTLDLVNEDPLGLLNEDDVDNSIFKLKNVKKDEKINPKTLSRRRICKNFEEYKEIFDSLHDDLKLGKRKLMQFKLDDLSDDNNFYVLNGVILFLESMQATKKENDFISGTRLRLDGKTKCIFDNGTESSMLLRSLEKGLNLDGFTVSKKVEHSKNEFIINNSDIQNGYIYILKSENYSNEITSIKNLFKIGFTSGDVTKRIQNAKTDPTFLLAPVKLMTTFTCYNIKPFELEQKIQNFFNEVRLDIEISYNGKLHKPREWFKVPKLLIEEAINLLMKDELNNYFYDTNIEEIVLRRET